MNKIRSSLVSFITYFRSDKKTILLILWAVAVTLVAISAISLLLTKDYSLHLSTFSNIKTLGVEAYWDNNTQNKILQIQWGTHYIGSSNNITIYLLSISNINATLNLTMINLKFYDQNQNTINPPDNISIDIHPEWDYDGSIIKPREIIQVTITFRTEYDRNLGLFIIENDIKTFSLDILIHSKEYII